MEIAVIATAAAVLQSHTLPMRSQPLVRLDSNAKCHANNATTQYMIVLIEYSVILEWRRSRGKR